MWSFPGIALALLSAGCAANSLPSLRPLDEDELAAYFSGEISVSKIGPAAIEFSDGGPAIRAEMLDLIREAEDYLLIDTFLLTDGPGTASREVLDALIEKHREGVGVYVIGDASSRWVPEAPAFEYLKEAGVPVAEFHPIGLPKLLWWPHILVRDHRKFWIADGRRIFLGGANISELSLIAPEDGGNLDLMAEFESPEAIREMVRSYVATWNVSRSDVELKEEDFAVAGARGLPGKSGNIWLFNQDTLLPTKATSQFMIDGLLASAEESVWLIQPYAFTNPHIVADCEQLVKDGVEVNMVLSTAVRAPRFHYASHYGIKKLIEIGVNVWIYESEVTPLHYKCALIDDRLAYMGSANLNLRSFRLSKELSIVFDDPDAVAVIGRLVKTIRAGCRRVDMAEAERYRGLPYLAWWLAMQPAG